MKYLKRFLYIFSAILVLIIALGIFMPREINLEVSKEFDVPSIVIFNIANDFNTQNDWNAWVLNDESMKLTMGEITKGQGASYTWTSDDSGNGQQIIREAIKNESIFMDIIMEEGDPMESSMFFNPVENGTLVTWNFNGKMGFLSNIFSPFLKRSIRKNYNSSLKNLENIAIKRWEEHEYFGLKIKRDDLPERHFVMRRAKIPSSEIQPYYVNNLGSIFQSVLNEGMEMDGMPCGLFFDYDATNFTTDMAAAIPISEPRELPNTALHTINAGQGLVVDHYGDYTGLPNVHEAIMLYMDDRGLINNAPVIEEYTTDPTEVDDPSKILTKVFYYLAKTQ